MNIIKHDTNKLHHSITFRIPNTEVAAEYERQLKDLAEKAKIPGFRPGKIPQALLQQRYGPAAYQDAVEECVHQSVHRLYTQENLRPSGQPSPNITIESAEQGSDVQVKVELEVLPNVEIGKLDSLEFKVLKADISDQDITNMVTPMLQRHSREEGVSVDRAAKIGDDVTINFEGQLDGVVRPEMCGENFDLGLGSGMFIPGFEDQLVGVKKDDQKDVSLNFPQDYHSEEFAGKPALFKVTVLDVKEIPVLEANDENVKKIGYDNLQALKDVIEKYLKEAYEKTAWKKSKRDILDVLEKHFHFDVPAGMQQNEFESIWQQFQAQLKQEAPSEELTADEEAKIKNKYQEIAERRVRLGLVLSKVGELNKLEVQEKEFQTELIQRESTNSAWMNQRLKQEISGKQQPVFLRQIQAELFEDKVLQFIVRQGKVTEIPTSIDDLNKEAKIDQDALFEE